MRAKIVFTTLILLISASPRFASATTYAPDSILQCPGSKEVIRRKNLASGNNMGRVAWSDGYVFEPFHPQLPQISRCRQGRYFWVRDAKVLGDLPHDPAAKVPAAWKSAAELPLLSGPEFLEALSQGLAKNPNEEMYLRTHVWWSANDPLRKDPKSPNPFSEGSPARENLEKLLSLYNIGDPEDLLTKAEALREMGSFKEAMELMKTKLPKEYQTAQKEMMSWTKKKDAVVKELFQAKKK